MRKLFLLLLLGATLFAFPSPSPAAYAASTFAGPLSSAPARSLNASQAFMGSMVMEVDQNRWCSQEVAYGARFTWITISWQRIEPRKNVYAWQQVDAMVQKLRACGMEVGAHVLAVSSWATPPSPPSNRSGGASMPPKNMNDYYNFVYNLARHYKGTISRYSIENEAHVLDNWAGTPDQYIQLLSTAYRAVHDADSGAMVEDAGLSSTGFGLLVANDLFYAGKQQDALDFMQAYFAVYQAKYGRLRNTADLQVLLGSPGVQYTVTWATLLYNNSRYFDALQVHYYAPWYMLTQVTDWVHTQLHTHGGDKPLDFWEAGYGWSNSSTFDPQAQARNMIKLYVTAIGEGAQRVVQFQFNDYAAPLGAPGLFTKDRPRPSATAFKVAASQVNGTTSAQRANLSSSVWGYRMESAERTVYVLWSSSPTTVSVPFSSRTVKVTDIAGNQTVVDYNNVTVTESPIFVEAGS